MHHRTNVLPDLFRCVLSTFEVRSGVDFQAFSTDRLAAWGWCTTPSICSPKDGELLTHRALTERAALNKAIKDSRAAVRTSRGWRAI